MKILSAGNYKLLLLFALDNRFPRYKWRMALKKILNQILFRIHPSHLPFQIVFFFDLSERFLGDFN